MSPSEWAVLAGALATIIGAVVLVRRAPTDLAKTRAEADQSAASALSRLYADFEIARERLDKTEGELTQTRAELDRCQADLMAAAARVVELRASMPMVTMATKLTRLSDSLRHVLDGCRDGIVLSTPENGATFVYVNSAFAQALGMTAEEVIAAGWQALVHPDDAKRTATTAFDAWSGGGEMSNRYRHKDGHYVRMRWRFSIYDEDGSAFSVVWFERRRTSSTAMPSATRKE